MRNMSSIHKIFKIPFELTKEETDNPYLHTFEYKTKEITGEITYGEIYDKCYIYFNYFREKYRNYGLGGERVQFINYNLYIVTDLCNELLDEELKNFVLLLHNICIDNHTDEIKKTLSIVVKNKKVKKNFYLIIEIELNHEYINSDDEDEDDDEDDEESFHDFVVKEVKTKKYCIQCKSNKPNILFINCNHLILCKECEENKNLKRCSECKSLISQKILIS